MLVCSVAWHCCVLGWLPKSGRPRPCMAQVCCLMAYCASKPQGGQTLLLSQVRVEGGPCPGLASQSGLRPALSALCPFALLPACSLLRIPNPGSAFCDHPARLILPLVLLFSPSVWPGRGCPMGQLDTWGRGTGVMALCPQCIAQATCPCPSAGPASRVQHQTSLSCGPNFLPSLENGTVGWDLSASGCCLSVKAW